MTTKEKVTAAIGEQDWRTLVELGYYLSACFIVYNLDRSNGVKSSLDSAKKTVKAYCIDNDLDIPSYLEDSHETPVEGI